jgi:hypothetical protein
VFRTNSKKIILKKISANWNRWIAKCWQKYTFQCSCWEYAGWSVGVLVLFSSFKAQAENFPFCTIEPNVGIVNVPDPRLQILGKVNKSEKVTSATMEFVDIAGIVKGASEGAGLGNKFLSNIRTTDAIVQVVRCFEDSNIIHGRSVPLSSLLLYPLIH